MIKSDGNGGFNVTKAGMALILFFITVTGTFSAVIATAVTVKVDVQNNMDDIVEIEADIEDLKVYLSKQQIYQAETKLKLENINKNLDMIQEKLN